MTLAKTSLCRFLRAAHYKSRHWSPAFSNRNFMRERAAAIFALCRPAAPGRNDVALWPTQFRAIMPKERQIGEGTISRSTGDSRGRAFVHRIQLWQSAGPALVGDHRARQGAHRGGRVRELP